jgi:hypothetical protein
MIEKLKRQLERLEASMVPPEAAPRGKIVVVFVEPDADGGPGKVVGEREYLVDLPQGGAR